MKLFHFHTWGKYGEPFGTDSHHDKMQTRRCQTCNICQVVKVKAPKLWFQTLAIVNKPEIGRSL